jgi:hypothetical protein
MAFFIDDYLIRFYHERQRPVMHRNITNLLPKEIVAFAISVKHKSVRLFFPNLPTENIMRALSAITLISVLTTACATQSPPPAAPAPAPAAEAKPAAKAPQCWSGDEGKFIDVGKKASVAGVTVECKLTGDGKSAQWSTGKH